MVLEPDDFVDRTASFEVKLVDWQNEIVEVLYESHLYFVFEHGKVCFHLHFEPDVSVLVKGWTELKHDFVLFTVLSSVGFKDEVFLQESLAAVG